MYNYRNVQRTITILSDQSGVSMSKRRITVSTSGIVPNIIKLAEDFPRAVNLAISLHAVTNELRSEIVPANRQWPLEELMAACRTFFEITGKKIAYEYVMLKGVNDSPSEARELARMLKNHPACVNLM